MQKQIIYSKFIPRLFAMTLDLCIFTILVSLLSSVLSPVLSPILKMIHNYAFIYAFQDFLIDQSINQSDPKAIEAAVRTPEFAKYFTFSRIIAYSGIPFLFNAVFVGVYFITFWHKFGATPGKMFLGMKIVDAETYGKPSLYSLIKRFLGYSTAIIGIWSMIFSSRCSALHDKIAHTVVIKR